MTRGDHTGPDDEHVALRRGESALIVERHADQLTHRFGRVGHALRESTTRVSGDFDHLGTRVRHLMRKGYALHQVDNDALLVQIAEDPENVEPYEVYADWLEQEGDPRAIVIRAGIKATQTQRASDADAFERLVFTQRFAFTHPEWCDGRRLRLDAVWRFGFIAEISTTVHAPLDNDHTFGPVKHEYGWVRRAVLQRLRITLSHPAGRFLRTLHVSARRSTEAFTYDVRKNDGVIELRKRA